MIERQSRTIICSVLFLDIVEYSRKPVAEQMKLRDRFNLLLSEILKGVAPNDRVILDTGDGAAVTFLGDPEDALFMALTLRDFLAAERSAPGAELRLRCGINLGPVKLVKDLNGRPNIIGDGINVAQRIMGFSQPGQVFVSRSYYEVVSRLTDEYSKLFQYEGSRTDKHVREHEVYAVSAGSPMPVRSNGRSRAVRLSAGVQAAAALKRFADVAVRLTYGIRSRPRLCTVVAVLAILTFGTALRISRESSAAAVADTRSAETQRVMRIDSPAAAPAAEQAQQPAAPIAAATAGHEGPVSGKAAVEAAPTTRPARKSAGRKLAAAKSAPQEQGEQSSESAGRELAAAKSAPQEQAEQGSLATVLLAVLPWGEVYVDGRQRGVSPPVRRIQVPPGQHEIEFRNTTFPSHVERIAVKPGDQITIRHKFEAGASK